MSDASNENKPNRPLSEISHLFLTSLREQAGENRAKPVRIPPQMKRASSPIPSEPGAANSGGSHSHDGTTHSAQADDSINAGDVQDVQRKRVTAVVGSQLGGQLHESVLAFAASLSVDGGRIGVITLDSSEFKLQLIDSDESDSGEETEVDEIFDSRRMNDSILELNHDVDRWLLVFSDARRPEARHMMRHADDWTLLCTSDHDGIVSGYRTLKGLAEGEKLPLSIAVVDAPSETQAEKAFNKLASVCRQFLDWDVTHVSLMDDVEHAQAHTILWCRAHRDKAQLATAPQWRVLEQFLQLAPDAAANAAHYGDADSTPAVANQPMSVPEMARPLVAATETIHEEPALPAQAPPEQPVSKFIPTVSQEIPMQKPNPMSLAPAAAASDELGEVIDLPEGASILAAVLRSGTQLLATPISAPMCAGATVAVGRDRGLVLVAQAGEGLSGMDTIAAAVSWLDSSKQLIAMAMPQLSIDPQVPTKVQLLIDHNDRTAEGIRPLLGNSRITIRSYRKLRWAGRTGLLLDAA